MFFLIFSTFLLFFDKRSLKISLLTLRGTCETTKSGGKIVYSASLAILGFTIICSNWKLNKVVFLFNSSYILCLQHLALGHRLNKLGFTFFSQRFKTFFIPVKFLKTFINDFSISPGMFFYICEKDYIAIIKTFFIYTLLTCRIL